MVIDYTTFSIDHELVVNTLSIIYEPPELFDRSIMPR